MLCGGWNERPTGSPLLGVLPDLSMAATTTELAVGDALILYTDGITEAMNADYDEFGVVQHGLLGLHGEVMKLQRPAPMSRHPGFRPVVLGDQRHPEPACGMNSCVIAK